MTDFPLLALISFNAMLTPEFWRGVYATGRFGAEAVIVPPLLVMGLARLLVVGCILLGAKIVSGVARQLIRRTFAAMAKRSGGTGQQQRLQTLQSLLSSAFAYLIYIIALIPVLFTIGLTWKALAALFATSSVVLVAIGLGSQKLVRDLVNGLFILGEGQFDVGDWVTIGSVTGAVTEIGLRITRLRDEIGREYIIANGDINQVFNASRGRIRLHINLTVPRARLDEALHSIHAAAAGALTERDIAVGEETLTLTVTGMDAANVTVRLTLRALQPQLEHLEDDIRRRLLQAQEAEALTLA